MTGVLFDRPYVVEGVDEQLAQEGLKERCQVAPGDFFQAVPAGADAYLLKYVIHDWDDERSLAILKNCRRAMTNDAKLLLVETIVPEPGTPHYPRLQDLEMLVIAGAQERTVQRFLRLLLWAIQPLWFGSALASGYRAIKAPELRVHIGRRRRPGAHSGASGRLDVRPRGHRGRGGSHSRQNLY
jgi:hypothetical protein